MDLAHIASCPDASAEPWTRKSEVGPSGICKVCPFLAAASSVSACHVSAAALQRVRYGCIHLDLFAVGEFLCMSAYFLLMAGQCRVERANAFLSSTMQCLALRSDL